MANNYYGYQYDTNPRKIKPEYKVKPEKVKNKPNNKMYKKILKRDNKYICKYLGGTK